MEKLRPENFVQGLKLGIEITDYWETKDLRNRKSERFIGARRYKDGIIKHDAGSR